MNRPVISHESAVAVVRDSIEQIAPDIDAHAIPLDTDMRIEAELDSMDFIAVLAAVKDRTGVDVPESDMATASTIDGCAAYVVANTTAERPATADDRADRPYDVNARTEIIES